MIPAFEIVNAFANLFDEAANPFTSTVKTTIGRLRAKLGDPPVVETIREAGYRL